MSPSDLRRGMRFGFMNKKLLHKGALRAAMSNSRGTRMRHDAHRGTNKGYETEGSARGVPMVKGMPPPSSNSCCGAMLATRVVFELYIINVSLRLDYIIFCFHSRSISYNNYPFPY